MEVLRLGPSGSLGWSGWAAAAVWAHRVADSSRQTNKQSTINVTAIQMYMTVHYHFIENINCIHLHEKKTIFFYVDQKYVHMSANYNFIEDMNSIYLDENKIIFFVCTQILILECSFNFASVLFQVPQ